MFPVTRSTSRSRFFKPAAATPAPATDPFFEYVPLLLNTSATNGAQNNTFLDSSTNNFSITRNGDTTQGSFNPYMPSGYWSGYFAGGSSQNGLTTTQTSIGTGNFTFAMWVYVVATPADSIFFDTGTNGFVLSSNSSRQLEFVERIGTTAIIAASASTAISLNTWVHIAVVRSGTGTNQVALYINGTSVATGTSNHNFTSTTISIGARFAAFGGNWLAANAYISNVLYADSALTITLPTTPYTNAAGVKLLCLQDNRFKDNSTNAFAITRNGDTRISKFAPFNPPASYSTTSYGGSGYFDGAGDYLGIADSTALDLNSTYTLEYWFYQPAAGDGMFFGRGGGAASWSNTNGMEYTTFILTGTFYYQFNNGSGSTPAQITTTAPASGQWHHVAVGYNGTTTRVWVDGASIGTSTSAYNLPTTRNITRVGLSPDGTVPLTGYVSNLRVVKGTDVYGVGNTSITVPTTPLTAITNTSLLLNFTNAGIYDAATINDGQTVGNAQVSTTQAKWSPTSMSFDGTGDYLTVIDKPELRLGTGDFTIEGWVYLNATGVAYGLVSKGTATTGWSVNVTSGNKLQFSYTATQLTGATSLASGTWYYFAVVRSGTASGNLRVILDGATDATSAGAVTDNFNQTNVLYVGADRVAGAVLNGYLQDVRITNGYARTTSTPTAAFPTL